MEEKMMEELKELQQKELGRKLKPYTIIAKIKNRYDGTIKNYCIVHYDLNYDIACEHVEKWYSDLKNNAPEEYIVVEGSYGYNIDKHKLQKHKTYDISERAHYYERFMNAISEIEGGD